MMGVIAVLAIGGVAAALLVAGGGSGGTKAANTVTVQRTASQPGTSTPSGGGSASGSGTATYRNAAYSFQHPSDWSVTADNVSKGTFSETRLVSRDRSQTVVVDHTPGETTPPATKARQIRGSGSTTTTFGPVTLGGRQGFEWVFTDGSQEKVDYLLNTGSDGFAVLGTSSPSTFSTVNDVSHQIANSITATGG
jgi:hypothetical protein